MRLERKRSANQEIFLRECHLIIKITLREGVMRINEAITNLKGLPCRPLEFVLKKSFSRILRQKMILHIR